MNEEYIVIIDVGTDPPSDVGEGYLAIVPSPVGDEGERRCVAYPFGERGVESVDVVEYHGPFEIGVGVGVFVRGGYVMGMDGA